MQDQACAGESKTQQGRGNSRKKQRGSPVSKCWCWCSTRSVSGTQISPLRGFPPWSSSSNPQGRKGRRKETDPKRLNHLPRVTQQEVGELGSKLRP